MLTENEIRNQIAIAKTRWSVLIDEGGNMQECIELCGFVIALEMVLGELNDMEYKKIGGLRLPLNKEDI